jgi:hypothetical protein
MWAAEPRRAGVLRNLEMLEMRPHVVMGFPLPAMYDGHGNFVRDRSKGTRLTLKAARDAHVPKIVEWNIPRGTFPDHDGEWKEQA